MPTMRRFAESTAFFSSPLDAPMPPAPCLLPRLPLALSATFCREIFIDLPQARATSQPFTLSPLHSRPNSSYYQRRSCPRPARPHPAVSCPREVARVRNSKAIASPRALHPDPPNAQAAPQDPGLAPPQACAIRSSTGRSGANWRYNPAVSKGPADKLLHRRPPNPEHAADQPEKPREATSPKDQPQRQTSKLMPPPGVNTIAAESTSPVRTARSQERS
jgi:hypothetical protein